MNRQTDIHEVLLELLDRALKKQNIKKCVLKCLLGAKVGDKLNLYHQFNYISFQWGCMCQTQWSQAWISNYIFLHSLSGVIPSEGRFNKKYRNYHYKVNMVSQPSHLHDGDPYTGKMAALYWISPLFSHPYFGRKTSRWVQLDYLSK